MNREDIKISKEFSHDYFKTNYYLSPNIQERISVGASPITIPTCPGQSVINLLDDYIDQAPSKQTPQMIIQTCRKNIKPLTIIKPTPRAFALTMSS